METDAVDGLEMTFKDKEEFFSYYVIVGNVLVMGSHRHFIALIIELDHFDLALMRLCEVVIGFIVSHEHHFHLASDAAMGQVDLIGG